MKAKRLVGTVLAAGLGLWVLGSAVDAQAQGKGAKETAAPSGEPDVPLTKKPIQVEPTGLLWGMSVKQVGELVDKLLDEDYKPQYKTVSPGVRMRALDAQLAEEKAAFRRSRIDFGRVPTGLDATPLRNEFTYMNKESMMSLTRNGQTRHFFFIQGKLWKVIDEYKLVEGGPYGKDFMEAVIKIAKDQGVPGRILQPDYDKGRIALEVDWKDAKTHFRIIQRTETAMALAYEDNATVAILSTLRTNKPVVNDEIDPAVAAAVKGNRQSDPPPPPADKQPPGKK